MLSKNTLDFIIGKLRSSYLSRDETEDAVSMCDTVERYCQVQIMMEEAEQVRKALTKVSLKKVKEIAGDGRHYTAFYAIFDGNPSDGDIADAQQKAGYAPQGYGMPRNVHTLVLAKDCIAVMWECSGNCD